jgi:hypothetical protein
MLSFVALVTRGDPDAIFGGAFRSKQRPSAIVRVVHIRTPMASIPDMDIRFAGTSSGPQYRFRRQGGLASVSCVALTTHYNISWFQYFWQPGKNLPCSASGRAGQNCKIECT